MKFVFVISSLVIIALEGYGQRSETLQLLKYTQKNGLPSYNVRKVVQDSKGFIWVGTQDGVSRFDGKTFLNYSKSSAKKNKICGVDVREIIEDSTRNLIWVLPGEVGINAINTITGEVIVTAPIPGLSTDDWNISMIKDGDILWIGTSTGIKKYNTSKNIYEEGLQLPRTPVTSTDFETRSIVKDENGNIWACYSGYGIVIYNSKENKIIKEIPLSELNDHNQSNDIRFYNYTVLRPGEILFATGQGLRKITYSSSYNIKIDNTPCKGFPELNTGSIDYITINKQREILVAGINKLYRFTLSMVKYTLLEEPPRTSETDWLSAVQNVYYDHENNMWLGCQEGLAFVSKYPSPFKPFNHDKRTNTKLEHVRSVYVLNNGDILAGLRNGIVNIEYAGQKYTKYDTAHLYHHIFQDSKGLVHVSRPDGMFIYNNGALTSISDIYTEFTPYASLPINSHIFINDSTIILGTESSNGILVWNPSARTVKKIEQGDKNGLGSSIVNNIYKDSKNNIWILSDNLIDILSPDLTKIKELIPVEKETGLAYKLFFDMCEADGYYWVASYGSGILQLDSAFNLKNVFNSERGLSNDGVYQVYNVNNKLVVTSNNGLSVLDMATFKMKNFFVKDGLHSNSFEEVAGIMNEGKIYAGGVNGFTVIDPKYFSPNNSPPILYIRNILIKTKSDLIDTSNLLINSIRIPNNVLQTTIYFSSINYFNPERTTISYRIEEQHSDWINIGNENSLPLIGLGHGTYTLQVKAINEDGIESEIKELTLIFLPKWYQTWWFKTLIGLAFIAIVYGLYRLRINQLKKEEKIRNQLAGDLHDELGSTLNGVKIFASLALMEKEKEKTTPHLEKIKEATQGAIAGVKDIIWVLDDNRDTVEDLLVRINQFAKPLCEVSGISYSQQIDESLGHHKLGKEEKRNLYMIIKESINNSIKYSTCENIQVSVNSSGRKLSFKIADDGVGFDNAKIIKGNGLKNIRYRSKEIGYRANITSSPGNGAVVEVDKI